jgi:Outer membrane protein beta-barrel family
MKKISLFLLSILVSLNSFAQNQYSIKGKFVDTTNSPLSFSSVFLLQPKDSTLVTFVRADENGTFIFKNLKKQDYLVKTTFLGLLPHQQLVKFSAENLTADIGTITLKPIQKDLLEIVVRTAKAPIEIRGDTIEYDARKFKVPPGSSVEDLLRKLPGMQVDAEGNIKAQGREVNKLTVDGKRFFGDDPKVATKSLPAEAINKVQVFDDKSEQSKLTGIEDGKKEKTINLELKEEFKKGGFGKATAGVGTEGRVMGKANYNKFDKKNQFAVVGFGNNINQTGLSNNDYQDFKGSQSYNWNDNADFGFGQGGMRFFSFGDDDDENIGMGVPQSYGLGQGLSKNLAGGANYNFDTKKTKVSTNYFFNQTAQTVNQVSSIQNFLPTTSYTNIDSSNAKNFVQNHRVSFRFEQTIDSLNTVVINLNGRLSNRTQNSILEQNFLNKTAENFRSRNSDNSYDANSSAISAAAIYRHKFKKKGRNFALSGTVNNNQNNQDGLQNSNFKEFTVQGEKFPLGGQIFNINQNVLGLSKDIELKSSVLYTEPLNKKFISETFINVSNKQQSVDRDVYNLSDARSRVDNLSRFFDNTIDSKRIGSALRYTHKGFNIGFGAAFNSIGINGKFYSDQNKPLIGQIQKTYNKLLPNISINAELPGNGFLFGGYEAGFISPKIKDLQPFTDNSNPLFITEGNPSLKPATTHSLNLGMGKFDPVSFIQIWTNVNYSYNIDQVIYNINVNDKLVSTRTPQNISGGQNLGAYFDFGFPIVKTKVAANLGFNGNIGKNLIYINSILNNNNNTNLGLNANLNFTPVDWFSMFNNIGFSNNVSKYSIGTTQNQRFTSTRIGSNMVIQMPKLFFFTADLNYNRYENKGLNFKQSVPLLNLSTYKLSGKAKKSEIRISLYDTFKKNAGINQNAFQNVISSSRTQTLSRYAMLTYTYNMKGIDAKVKKSQWE